MPSGDPSLATVQQLSRQLHVVSEIAESLTIRLLSLEERIQQLEVDADHPSAHDEEHVHEAPWMCVLPLCITAVGSVLLFFFASPIRELLLPIFEGGV